MKETSKWAKDVKKAAIDKNMTFRQIAEKIGCSVSTLSQVVNGRYSNSTYKEIAEKINNLLGTSGLPERIDTPSDEWCQAVKIELLKQQMSVTQLAEKLDVSRDTLSLVVNGKLLKPQLIESINTILGISIPAIPLESN